MGKNVEWRGQKAEAKLFENVILIFRARDLVSFDELQCPFG